MLAICGIRLPSRWSWRGRYSHIFIWSTLIITTCNRRFVFLLMQLCDEFDEQTSELGQVVRYKYGCSGGFVWFDDVSAHRNRVQKIYNSCHLNLGLIIDDWFFPALIQVLTSTQEAKSPKKKLQSFENIFLVHITITHVFVWRNTFQAWYFLITTNDENDPTLSIHLTMKIHHLKKKKKKKPFQTPSHKLLIYISWQENILFLFSPFMHHQAPLSPNSPT